GGFDELAELVAPECVELLRMLERECLPVPKVGYALVNTDHIVIAECELAWPAKKLAVLLPSQPMEMFTGQGWDCLVYDSNSDVMGSLLEKLKGLK
ncbi:hypothetical protein N9048_02235, partial [bacterium]|nr:hypothetical protein [bacterium]